MGLPTSREGPIGTHAPVTGTRIAAIEDNIIGHKRKPFTRNFYPKFMQPGGFVGGANPINGTMPPSYNSAGAVGATCDIEYEDGDRITNLKYFATGNGTTDLTIAFIAFFPGMVFDVGAGHIADWTDNNRPAGWAVVDVGAITTFNPTVLTAGGILQVSLQTNAGGYSIGWFTAFFDRL